MSTILSNAPDRPEAIAEHERRKSPRYEPAEFQSWIGWWEDRAGRDFRVQEASLEDISRGGARFIMAERIPAGTCLWFTVRGVDTAKTVIGEVLESSAKDDDGYRLRVRFIRPCPDEIMEAAVLGIPMS
jgi:hypothetical protein